MLLVEILEEHRRYVEANWRRCRNNRESASQVYARAGNLKLISSITANPGSKQWYDHIDIIRTHENGYEDIIFWTDNFVTFVRDCKLNWGGRFEEITADEFLNWLNDQNLNWHWKNEEKNKEKLSRRVACEPLILCPLQ